MATPGPIKPAKTETHGGVTYNANDVKAKGINENGKYFLIFNDGTKVVYDEQKNKQGLQAALSGTRAENMDGLCVEITDNNPSWWGYDYKLNNCTNSNVLLNEDSAKGEGYITVRAENGKQNKILLENTNKKVCVDLNNEKNSIVSTGEGNDVVSIVGNNQPNNKTSVKTGGGDDSVHIYDQNNVFINPGAGQDKVEINQNYNNNANVEQNIPLPNGEVTLGSGDKLGIHIRDGLKQASVSVEGRGTHRIEDTPKDAFTISRDDSY